jgi:nickel-dependent lactate racemase
MRIDLPFGGRQMSIALPDGIPVRLLRPAPVEPHPDPEAAVRKALDHPIGSPLLEEMARPGQRVALIVDDITRPTPVALVLPEVLRRLSRAGVRSTDVTIVIALGSHRPMLPEEIARHLGKAAAGYRVVQSDAYDEAQFENLGFSQLGIPVQIHRTVLESDLRVAIGNIVPHSDAGWGGGAKIVFPGVAGLRSIAALHLRGGEGPPTAFGSDITPVRMDIEALVAEIGLHFIVNTVLTGQGQLYRVVAGHFLAAHRRGVGYAKEVFGIAIPEAMEAALINAYPAELDFWQASKALFAGVRIVRPGGRMLLVAPCPEGFGPHPMFGHYLGLPSATLAALVERGEAEEPIAAGGALLVAKIRDLFSVAIYSPGLTEGQITAMGFEPVRDPQAWLARLGVGELAAITHGGETCPYISGRE